MRPAAAAAHLIACLLLLVAAAPRKAFAAPVGALRWDTCDDGSAGLPTDKGFAGPGAYTQVISARGFSEPILGLSLDVEIRAPGGLPEAWRFDPAGCQAGAVAYSIGGVSKACPAISGGSIVLSSFTYDAARGTAHVRLTAALSGTTTPNPSATYVLAKITYDHSLSVPGPSVPGACGGADAPVCFELMSASYLDAQGNEHALALANPLLTWQNPTGSSPCFELNSDGVRVGELLPQCNSADTTLQYVELVTTDDRTRFDSNLHLRIRGADGTVRYDAGNLFGPALENQPWAVGQAWLLATGAFASVEGVAPDGVVPGALDPTGGQIELYDARDPSLLLQSVGYGPGHAYPLPPPGSALARQSETAYAVAAPAPRNASGQSPAGLACPIKDEAVRLRQVSASCIDGTRATQYVELRAPVDQRFRNNMRIVYHDHLGTLSLEESGLFGAPAEGALWPAGRSWLLGGTFLGLDTGAKADLIIAGLLDPKGGSVDVYGGTNGTTLLDHLAYGPGAPLPAPPPGWAMTRQPDGTFALDESPAPVNFAGTQGSSPACFCPGPLCADGAFTGTRIDRVALQCANSTTTTQYVVLRSTASGQTFRSDEFLRALDHTGHTIFDTGNLFAGKANGTAWPTGTAWLLAASRFDESASIHRDAALPGALDSLGGTLVLYDHRAGGAVLSTLIYGPAGMVAAPAPGQSIHRIDDATWAVVSQQDPESFAGGPGALTHCPCPLGTLALQYAPAVPSSAAQRDSSAGGSRAAYDILAGTARVANSETNDYGYANAAATDLFTVTGLASGQPVDVLVRLNAVATGTQWGGFCLLTNGCTFAFASANLGSGANRIGAALTPDASDTTLALTVHAVAGLPFALTWEVQAQSYASPGDTIKSTCSAALSFPSLPAGASIVSCNGYHFDQPTPTLPAILVARPALDDVHLEWSANAALVPAARVERIDGDAGTAHVLGLATALPDRYIYDDRAVQAGAHYGYRLRWATASGDATSELTWVDVPAARLALRALGANPSLGAPVIEYTLPALGEARLELLDLRGRRVWSRDLGVQAPGSHAYTFVGGPTLAAGVYWARVVEAGNQALLRLVVLGHGR